MINRAERRYRKQVIWDRRVKRFYQMYNNPTVPCEKEELPVHNYRCKTNHRYWRPATTWKESYRFKEKDLPDGKYAFTYEVTDITGKSTMSDVAFLNLKNGEIKPEL